MLDQTVNILDKILNSQLLAGFIAGLIVLFIEYRTRRSESNKVWFNQVFVERRLRMYEEVMPLYNDLLCYLTQVGKWKNFEPTEIIEIKRQLDRRIYVERSLFSENFFVKHQEFMDVCFLTYTGVGENAKLRVSPENYRVAMSDRWKVEHDKMFGDEQDRSSKKEIRQVYDSLVISFRHELGLK